MKQLSTSLVSMLPLIAAVSAFCPIRSTTTRPLRVPLKMKETTKYPHREFHRAIDCVEEVGLCSVDEMMKLADDLEKYDQCFFEKDDAELCEKEKKDRMDVADLLRLEAEVLLREDYLLNANLFKEDVDKSRVLEKWEDHQDELDMYSNY